MKIVHVIKTDNVINKLKESKVLYSLLFFFLQHNCFVKKWFNNHDKIDFVMSIIMCKNYLLMFIVEI